MKGNNVANQLTSLDEFSAICGVDPDWLIEQTDNCNVPCVRIPDGHGGYRVLLHFEEAANAIAMMATKSSPKQTEASDAQV